MKRIDEKQFLLITIIWFFVAYFLLWFFGGACLNVFVAPSQVSSTCIANSFLAGLKNIPIIGLFVPYQNWVSLFYWFAPIAGFVLAFFGIKWWNNYFETKEATSIIVPIVLVLFLLVGHLVTLNWYYSEVAALNSR